MSRQFLNSGYNLLLGGISYTIEGVEGCGNNSVVYLAAYEDGLNAGSWHRVLIKELFPYHPKDMIWRNLDGKIVHADECDALWEEQRKSFYRGNQVNLELLGENPESTSGNLNSFEAYGTYYSVLTLHGGHTLADIMEITGGLSLEQIGSLTVKILEALDGFHRNGYLHLDISPDNILVTGERVLLIDYNSVWPLKSEETSLCYSVKAGYTAPEVRLREKQDIGTAADIYSVCAVYFHMLTRRRPEPADTFGRGVFRALPKTLDVFVDVPGSAIYQTVKIAVRGLSGLPQQRYCSVAQLLAEIRELMCRIEGRGVTLCALWEGSRKAALAIRHENMESFPRSVLRCRGAAPAGAFGSRSNGVLAGGPESMGGAVDADGLSGFLENGQNLFLTGSGGMGKTTLLHRLWRENVSTYRPERPVMIYISLAGYQENTGESGYLRRRLLELISFDGDVSDGCLSDLAGMALDKLLDGPETALTAGVRLILLLDGLNEAGSHRVRLLKEIAALGRKKGVAVLVTGRTEDIKPYGFESFERLLLMPLAAEAVRNYLAAENIGCPEDGSFLGLLENPMVLSLYVRTVKMSREGGEGSCTSVAATAGAPVDSYEVADSFENSCEAAAVSENPECGGHTWTMDRIVECFLEEEKVRELSVYSGDDVQQQRIAYMIDHLLPEIAGEMARRKKTLLTAREMAALLERDYCRMKGKAFGRAFPEYIGKSRKLFDGIGDAGEWYDCAVCEQLTERMNLLVKTKSGSFSLLHDNFSGCLISRYKTNKRLLERSQRTKRLWICGAVFAAIVLTTAAIAVLLCNRPFPSTPAEQHAVKNAMNCLAWNMQLLDNQLAAQQMLLENASGTSVLDGDEQACKALAALAERKISAAAIQIRNGGGGNAWIEELTISRNTIPLDILQNIYLRPEKMQPFFAESAGYLITALCGENVSLPRERKMAMIDAYSRYLKAYATVAYLDFMQVLAAVPKDERDEILDAMAGTAIFSACMAENDFGAMTAEEYEKRQKAAQEVLDGAENEMLIQGYPVSEWP